MYFYYCIWYHIITKVHVKQLYFSKSTCAPNIILFFHQVPENMHITFWCFILINKNKIHYKLFKMFSKNCLKCSCRSTFLAICPHYFLHISHFFMAHLPAGCVCIFKLLIWIKLPLYFKYLSIQLPICYCNELLSLRHKSVPFIELIFTMYFLIFALIQHYDISKNWSIYFGGVCST